MRTSKARSGIWFHRGEEAGAMSAGDVPESSSSNFPSISEPTVMFVINRSMDNQAWTEVNIYRATQCSWVISEHARDQAKYALGVERGTVRGAFVIEGWRNVGGNRWCFDGRSAVELDVVGTRLDHLKPKKGDRRAVRLYLDGVPGATEA